MEFIEIVPEKKQFLTTTMTRDYIKNVYLSYYVTGWLQIHEETFWKFSSNTT